MIPVPIVLIREAEGMAAATAALTTLRRPALNPAEAGTAVPALCPIRSAARRITAALQPTRRPLALKQVEPGMVLPALCPTRLSTETAEVLWLA